MTWQDAIASRLEELRVELRAERISYGELAELQSLAPFIDRADVELLEAAGVPEFPAESTLSDHDRENVGELVAGAGTWFSAKLLRLIADADAENRERLRLGFPDHVAAYEAWRDGVQS